MSPFSKRLLFVVVGCSLLGLIGVWNQLAQLMLGQFALGWMMFDIAQSVFPEK